LSNLNSFNYDLELVVVHIFFLCTSSVIPGQVCSLGITT